MMAYGPWFLLYRQGGRVRVTDGSHLVANNMPGFPPGLSYAGREYLHLKHEDGLVFWNELRDAANLTVGFIFNFLKNPALSFDLFQRSENVTMDQGDASILLRDGVDPVEECIQGFGSAIYQCRSDPKDCLLFMLDFSENPIGFELDSDCPVTFLI